MPLNRHLRARGCLRRWAGLFLIGLLPAAGLAAPLSDHARDFRTELITKILPYWYDTTLDAVHGGYLLADELKGRGQATEKQLVSQSRLVWGFAHAHRRGLSDGRRDYLQAARRGYLFLLAHFRDLADGGYYWKTDVAGQPTNESKFLYGQAFVIYAFVEFARASQDKEPLERALELYRDLQKHLHDAKHGGWIEHTTRNWKPFALRDPRSEVEIAGFKSANAHLHWMEALAELCDATKDAEVRASLAEALRINREYFYPQDPAQSAFHRQADWQPVTDPRSAGLSYGHNVEFAWLMIRAQQVLGEPPAWDHFEAHLEHALKYGYDHERGGLYHRGVGNQPANDTSKVWWAQAEMMAALTDGFVHRPDARYRDALEKLIHFVLAYQVDKRDGIWLDTVAADGKPLSPAKAHSWKANYHDVRGLVKFIDGFLTSPL